MEIAEFFDEIKLSEEFKEIFTISQEHEEEIQYTLNFDILVYYNNIE